MLNQFHGWSQVSWIHQQTNNQQPIFLFFDPSLFSFLPISSKSSSNGPLLRAFRGETRCLGAGFLGSSGVNGP